MEKVSSEFIIADRGCNLESLSYEIKEKYKNSNIDKIIILDENNEYEELIKVLDNNKFQIVTSKEEIR